MGLDKMETNKIIYVHPTATPRSMTGLNRPHDLGVHFIAQGFNFEVVSSSFLHYTREQVKNSEVVEDGIKYNFIKTNSYGNVFTRVYNMFSFTFKLYFWLLKNTKPNDTVIISSPHLFSPISGVLAKRKVKFNLITEVRDLWPEAIKVAGYLNEKSLSLKGLRNLEKWIYKNSDEIVFLKPGDYTYLVEREWTEVVPLYKCHYINNGIDLEWFNSKKNSLIKYFDNSKLNIVYSGSLRPMNNIELILDTALLLKNNSKIMFHIYGDGPNLSEYEGFIENNELSNVIFYGFVKKDELPSILSQADYNLLNYHQSRYDWSRGNSSNKLFEYLASGVPIISTIKIGYLDIEGNFGYVTKENTAESLKELLEDICENDYTSSEEELKNKILIESQKYDYSLLSNTYLKIIGGNYEN